jgi:hypothetical protein
VSHHLDTDSTAWATRASAYIQKCTEEIANRPRREPNWSMQGRTIKIDLRVRDREKVIATRYWKAADGKPGGSAPLSVRTKPLAKVMQADVLATLDCGEIVVVRIVNEAAQVRYEREMRNWPSMRELNPDAPEPTRPEVSTFAYVRSEDGTFVYVGDTSEEKTLHRRYLEDGGLSLAELIQTAQERKDNRALCPRYKCYTEVFP